MRIDGFNRYSVAQSLAASAVSTNLIDHGADVNLGLGEPMSVMIDIVTQLDGTTGDESYTAQLQTSVDEAFSVPIFIGGAIQLRLGATGILGGAGVHGLIGTRFELPVPADARMARFSRLNYVVAGTTPSGAVNATLMKQSHIQNEVVYPKNYTGPTG